MPSPLFRPRPRISTVDLISLVTHVILETEAAPASPFSYTTCPLADGDIRLLEPTDEANGLHWSIRTASLDSQELKYDALSYMWGSPTQNLPIICNVYPFHVHGNLYSALPFLTK
jgi:hypothetical protein